MVRATENFATDKPSGSNSVSLIPGWGDIFPLPIYQAWLVCLDNWQPSTKTDYKKQHVNWVAALPSQKSEIQNHSTLCVANTLCCRQTCLENQQLFLHCYPPPPPKKDIWHIYCLFTIESSSLMITLPGKNLYVALLALVQPMGYN